MTAAQSTKLSTEALTEPGASAQAVRLTTEALTEPGASAQAVRLTTEALAKGTDGFAQAVRLSPEVLASVVLAGAGQLIRLPVEIAGNVPDVSAHLSQLTLETAGAVPDVTAQMPLFWVDGLLSVQEAGPARLVALPVEVCAPIDPMARLVSFCVEILMVPYIRQYPCLDRAPPARSATSLQGVLSAAYIDRDAHDGCVEAQPSNTPNTTPQE